MKRLIFILAAPFSLLLVLLGAYYFSGNSQAPLSKAPEHGVCFTLEADTGAQGTNGLAALKGAVQRRFARFGERIFWEPVSQTQFRVYAPILNTRAVEAAGALVSKRGLLEFRLVHPEKPELLSAAEGYEVMQLRARPRSGTNEYVERYLLSKTAEGGPSGIKVREAMATRNSSTGTCEIHFKLTPESAEAFRRTTQQNIGRQLAIVMDGVLLSAPIIRGEIPGGSGVISGDYDGMTAMQLAILMEIPLPAGVELLATRSF